MGIHKFNYHRICPPAIDESSHDPNRNYRNLTHAPGVAGDAEELETGTPLTAVKYSLGEEF
jgi:hypothetical protein